jgi:hypothetical protein
LEIIRDSEIFEVYEVLFFIFILVSNPFGSGDSHMKLVGCSQGIAENKFSKIEAHFPSDFAGWSGAQFRMEAAIPPSHWKSSSTFFMDVMMGTSKRALF